MTTAYIALGSNLGDRAALLDAALEMLRGHPRIEVRRVSPYLETEPVGGPPGQGRFLNAAAEIETPLSAAELLEVLLDVERRLGRVRRERNGPRTLDLDLLLHGNDIIESPELTVPHPRLHERAFVLRPLAEIAPQLVHPELGRTVQELLAEVESQPVSAPSPARQPSPAGGELSGLRCLVTGSTSGIGRATALELARAGADVIVHGRRSPERADEVAAAVRAAGRRAESLLADLRRPEECRRLVEAGWACWDGLDVWVNNAGADTLTGEAAGWPFERKWQELLDVDVNATILLSRLAGEQMHQAGGGVIVTTGWDQAETGMEGDSGQLFAASKGAVMAFTRSLALTLAPRVRVNCVAPGWIRTAWGETASSVWQDRVRRETPLQRWGTPEDVAAAVRWLVSPASAFLTGQVIRVNGGAVR